MTHLSQHPLLCSCHPMCKAIWIDVVGKWWNSTCVSMGYIPHGCRRFLMSAMQFLVLSLAVLWNHRVTVRGPYLLLQWLERRSKLNCTCGWKFKSYAADPYTYKRKPGAQGRMWPSTLVSKGRNSGKQPTRVPVRLQLKLLVIFSSSCTRIRA